MKKVIIIFFAMLMLVQSLGKVWIMVAYQINKAYIEANLCENKDKPLMGCAGKCYLKKQLAKEQNAVKQLQETLKEFSVFVHHQINDNQWFSTSNLFLGTKPSLNVFYWAFYAEYSLEAVFRPPAFR
ncbi:hypothetical protein [Flexibacter flexilis]|uniref:hypothetical protein n=1 Tax=Flexibacter flexilis TaxID=998 RepID=UPI00116055CD|nr:hypothetical protein [Flexibacter flexilis]